MMSTFQKFIFGVVFSILSASIVSVAQAAAKNSSETETSASLETQLGSTLLSEAIDLDGSFGAGEHRGQDPGPLWNWNVGFSHARVNSSQASTAGSTTVYNDTNEWVGGFGFARHNGLSFEAGVLSSNTPDEGLSATGGDMTLGYKFKLADEDEDGFSPSLRFRFKVGRKTYEQKFSSTRVARVRGKTVVRPTSGSVSLNDTFYRPSLTWRPADRWSVTIGYQVDVFSQDVAQFQSLLDSSRVLQSGAGGLGNAIGGLSQITDSISVTRDVKEWLSVILSESYSISATDLTPIYNTSLKFDSTFGEIYNLILGISYQSSSFAYDTVGSASFGVTF